MKEILDEQIVSSAFRSDDDNEDETTYNYDDEMFKETDFDDEVVSVGREFIEDGKEWKWVKQTSSIVHIDFDNWAVWEAQSTDDDYIAYFVVDVDTGFIDWGPCDTDKEAIEFLNSKEDDEEEDSFSLRDYSDEEMDELDEAVNDMDSLDAAAMTAHADRDINFFLELTDEKLAKLWALCNLEANNPLGRVYGEYVHEAISERRNSQEIFNKAKEIAAANGRAEKERKLETSLEDLKEDKQVMKKHLFRDDLLDAIDYLVEFKDIFPFPKEEFLASDWEDLRTGVYMGIDPEIEVAEGILQYLDKDLSIARKHPEIFEDDPQSELSLETYNALKKAFDKEIERLSECKKTGEKEILNEDDAERVSAIIPNDLLNNPDKVDFKSYVKKRSADMKAEKERQEKEARMAERAAQYKDVLDHARELMERDNAEAAIEVLFEALVPQSGPADTVAGELVRAMMRILYRDYNDGDLFYEGYGIETCGSSVAYIIDVMGDHLIDAFEGIALRQLQDDSYTKALKEVTKDVVKEILNNNEYITTDNEEDSRSTKWEEYYEDRFKDDWEPRYDYSFEVADKIYEHIHAGNITMQDVVSRMEDDLMYESVFNGAEVYSRGEYLTIENLTKEALEQLEYWATDIDRYWSDYIDELNDEYGDPDDDLSDEELDESKSIKESFPRNINLDQVVIQVANLLDDRKLGDDWIEVFPTRDARQIVGGEYFVPLEITGPDDVKKKATFRTRNGRVEVAFLNGRETVCDSAESIARFIASEFGLSLGEVRIKESIIVEPIVAKQAQDIVDYLGEFMNSVQFNDDKYFDEYDREAMGNTFDALNDFVLSSNSELDEDIDVDSDRNSVYYKVLSKLSLGVATSKIDNQPNIGLTFDIEPTDDAINKVVSKLKSLGFTEVDHYEDDGYLNDSYIVFTNEINGERVVCGIVYNARNNFAFVTAGYDEAEDSEYFDSYKNATQESYKLGALNRYKESLLDEDIDVDSEDDMDVEETNQKYTSAKTSINSSKLPAIFKMIDLKPGTINLDFGGGKFDNVAEYLVDKDVTNLVYDPYNRSSEHNKEVIEKVKANGGADSATISNVLNVIAEETARNIVLNNVYRLTKPDAAVYITVYEGDSSGNSAETKSGYQLNRKTADYMEEIEKVFPNVVRKGKLIIAKK